MTNIDSTSTQRHRQPPSRGLRSLPLAVALVGTACVWIDNEDVKQWKRLHSDTSVDGGMEYVSIRSYLQGDYDIGDAIHLGSVVATSTLGPDWTGFFVQDAGGGARSGVVVYLQGFDVSVDVGDVMHVTGEANVHLDQTQVRVLDEDGLSKVGEATAQSTVLTSPPDDLAQYESVLIKLVDVSVTSGPDENGLYETDFDIGIGGRFGTPNLVVGTQYASITGPLDLKDDQFQVAPRDSNDVVE